ncbi:uncharacterized protein LTHEOB_801 [Lasiodiplodia theobromae]|uniref:Uncharacterized protein n=1 Tax=Lasiodiplodia theobromae TaxID=45133 RepID=A0A5N5DR80_9PEZI|nr:uncharacterized protein LTHEOB_801 [Lasiodiplodia theobromae]KAB2579881.1 hypothetical protein DBV05_g1410 [Lasiodiplodia theobromae]KAF4540859.1 hypothetical protein LTHEOB_801 [Lasiodiplodia theobromae]
MSSTAKYHPLLSPISSPRPSHSPFYITPPRSPHNIDVELEPFGGGEEHPAPPPPLLRRHSAAHRFCRVFALVAAWGSMTVLAVALILFTSYKAMLILTGKGGGDGGQHGGGVQGGAYVGGGAGGQYGGQHSGGGGP